MKNLNKEEQKQELKRINNYRELKRIESYMEKISNLVVASQITLRAYENLYNAVDEMFYNTSNQWRDGEEGIEIEEVVGDLRKLMYGN